MARINLLPWREERRQERRKEFLIISALVALVGVLIIVLTEFVISSQIDNQQSRNAYLQQHISQLNRQVKEIKDLEKRRQDLLERMKIIQDLQGKRPLIVRLFDEQVRTLPDGVFFRSLKRNEDKIVVDGVAESNNRISSLMRNLDGSDWFSDPNLTAVSAASQYGEQASSFSLGFKVTSPDDEETEEAK